ncbi:hypothetical protein DLM76_14045 [Leptospira yasudae]|nr:hypothetical protein DLM76_14045 [Leptospira yasudae]
MLGLNILAVSLKTLTPFETGKLRKNPRGNRFGIDISTDLARIFSSWRKVRPKFQPALRSFRLKFPKHRRITPKAREPF